MREGWTYKKLGEVCEIARGGSPRPITDFITDNPDGINWIKIGDAVEGDKYIRSTKEKIIKEGVKKSRFVQKGDFILSNSMSFGRPYILAIDGCIHDGWLVLHDNQGVFIKDFLYYLLSSPSMYSQFEKLAVGGVVNNLNSKLVSNVFVAIPPKSQQEAIVSELDEINSLLALKREQLQKYDKLAQSLFYEMFGDPVENEKGWVVKNFGDVLESATKGPFGSDIKKSLYVPKSESTYKVYVQVNAISKDVTLGDYYISKEYFDQKMYKFEVAPGDYLITCDGTMGKFVRLPQIIERGIISASLLRLTLNKQINSSYFEHLWDLFMLPYLLTQVRNAALQHLPAASKIAQVEIPLPPLSLQQQFSSRIEQIESQKQQVQAAIEKLETLLASRMQYWFD